METEVNVATKSAQRQFVIPCRAAELRGVIRHSHLQNRFLTWLPSSPDLIRKTYDHGASARLELEAALKELADTLGDTEAGFSPIGLLDELGPLKRLPEPLRESMRRAMTRAYARSFDPVTRAADLRAASTQFVCALDRFLADSGKSANFVEALHAAADRLYEEISKLPKGIWLWPEQEGT